MASEFSKLLGKDVNYVAVPPQAAREAMQGMGLPEFLVEGYVELYDGFAQGLFAETTDSVETITGSKAHTFAEYAEAFKGFFA